MPAKAIISWFSIFLVSTQYINLLICWTNISAAHETRHVCVLCKDVACYEPNFYSTLGEALWRFWTWYLGWILKWNFYSTCYDTVYIRTPYYRNSTPESPSWNWIYYIHNIFTPSWTINSYGCMIVAQLSALEHYVDYESRHTVACTCLHPK